MINDEIGLLDEYYEFGSTPLLFIHLIWYGRKAFDAMML